MHDQRSAAQPLWWEVLLSPRVVAAALAGVALAYVLFEVELDYFEAVPGEAISLPAIVEIDADTTEVDGDLAMLTIGVDEPTVAEFIRAQFDDDREISPKRAFIPEGQSDEEFFDEQRAVFEDSFMISVALGLQAAGVDVPVATEPLVAQVLDGGPADGLIEPGDRVISVDETPITAAQQIVDALDGRDAGDVVDVVVLRAGNDEPIALTLTLAEVDGIDRPAVGIAIEDRVLDEPDLPFDVSLTDERVGGPSAGLMLAVTIADLVDDDDLVAGRRIAGTGSLDSAGNVGPIGGINLKVAGALRDGYDHMFVPEQQIGAARASLDPGDQIELVPVGTLDDAIEWLRAG